MSPQAAYTGEIMTPEPLPSGSSGYTDSFDDEPPLLEGTASSLGPNITELLKQLMLLNNFLLSRNEKYTRHKVYM